MQGRGGEVTGMAGPTGVTETEAASASEGPGAPLSAGGGRDVLTPAAAAAARWDTAAVHIEPTRLWHITLTLSGIDTPADDVRRALEQLADDHPFMLTGRYATDHAEIRYWEEARDLHDAAALALRLWGEHRRSAGLPPWELIGLEVVDRTTYQQRALPVVPVGVHPF